MHSVKYVHWQDGDWWLGYLEEYPDYWTQGETLQDLVEHLKNLYVDLSSEHVGGRISVEEPLYAEPPHDTTAHLLGERGQIRLGDRPSRQERRRPVTGRHKDAVGRTRMQVHDRRQVPPMKMSPASNPANGATAIVGRAERITRSDSRGWSGWMRPSLGAAEEFPIHARGRIFRVGADRR